MAENLNTTRRAVLSGLAALPLVTVPSLAHAADDLNLSERLERDASKLAATMAEIDFGNWTVTIVSGDAEQDINFHNIGSPRRRAEWLLRQAHAALEQLEPGAWALGLSALDQGWSLSPLYRRDGGVSPADDMVKP